MRVYADFNGLVRSQAAGRFAVALDTWGTVHDLSNARVRLSEGLRLTAFDWSDEAEDLEGTGTVRFAGPLGVWLLELDDPGVAYVPAGDRGTTSLHCFHCRAEVSGPRNTFHSGAIVARDDDALCPQCNSPLAEPIRP
jgi:hypothetical protein